MQNLLSRTRPAEGALVRASYQQAGKGLLKNTWESKAGKNLLFSFVLYPDFLPLKNAFLLSQAMALGVRDWVGGHAGEGVFVKWPNDVYIGGKKAAGMLIQNALSGTAIQHSIVGIGINVNQTEFSPELPNPGSLKGATGKDYDLAECLNALCGCLEERYLQLKAGKREVIQTAYLRHLYGFGEMRTFARPGGERFEGRITGVAENGYLEVETANGLQSFEVKEVQLVANL